MVGGLSSWEAVRRGSISWVDFDALDTDDLPPMRPPLIVTAVALNRARHIVMVVPLATGPQPRPPIVIATPSAGQGRVAGCDQACAVDKGTSPALPADSPPPTSRPSRTGLSLTRATCSIARQTGISQG